MLFLQTRNGYNNLYTIAADGSAPLKELTKDNANARLLSMDNKRTKAAWISGRGEVKLLDTKTLEVKTAVKDEIWGNRGSTPHFSPNGEYLVFNVYKDFEADIIIHHIKTGKTTNLTNTGVTEADPMWSPDSKYLYFVSNPLKPAYPFGLNPRRYSGWRLRKMMILTGLINTTNCLNRRKKIPPKRRILPFLPLPLMKQGFWTGWNR
jgi:tricorn protease